MHALRQPNNRLKLTRHTELAPLRANATRWSSMFTMLKRYERIREAARLVGSAFELVPKPAMHGRIVALIEDLRVIYSITKEVQDETILVADVRVLFDHLIERFPAMTEHLHSTVRIVHSPPFERALIKVFLACGLLPLIGACR